MKIVFFIPGTPCGQPRIHVARGCAYTPHGPIDGWRGAIMWGSKAHRPVSPWSGPVRVDRTFYFPRPKYHFKKDGTLKERAPIRHIVKPDVDNCDKALLDALTKSGFFVDDCQVCAGEILKFYAVTEPGVRVEITDLDT